MSTLIKNAYPVMRHCADLNGTKVFFDMQLKKLEHFTVSWGASTAIVHLPEGEACKLLEHPNAVGLTEKLEHWIERYLDLCNYLYAQILTPEKIAAYDRGEYDDLDNHDKGVNPEHSHDDFRAIVISYKTCLCRDLDHGDQSLRSLHMRQHEAELISRYKAGLL